MSGLDQSSIGGAGRCRSHHSATLRSPARTGAGSERVIRLVVSAERAATRRIACKAAVFILTPWSDK